MARPIKYPKWPGPGEKEVPYDTEHFKMWCVNEEGLPKQTAIVYVSRIRTAFEVVFKGNYSIFELLSQAFRGYLRHPEICLKNLELASDHLGRLIELMRQLPPEEFFERNGLDFVPETISEWASAFSAYHRYYEWRIDRIRKELGIPAKSYESRKSRLWPLKKEFSEYLNTECRYKPKTVWSHVTYLTKLKYLFLDFITDEDIFEVISEADIDRESIKSIFDNLFRLTDIEMEMIKKELPDHFSVILSVNDLKRGKNALKKYRDFINYRIKNKQILPTPTHPD